MAGVWASFVSLFGGCAMAQVIKISLFSRRNPHPCSATKCHVKSISRCIDTKSIVFHLMCFFYQSHARTEVAPRKKSEWLHHPCRPKDPHVGNVATSALILQGGQHTFRGRESQMATSPLPSPGSWTLSEEVEFKTGFLIDAVSGDHLCAKWQHHPCPLNGSRCPPAHTSHSCSCCCERPDLSSPFTGPSVSTKNGTLAIFWGLYSAKNGAKCIRSSEVLPEARALATCLPRPFSLGGHVRAKSRHNPSFLGGGGATLSATT